jgi:hypothetical protein
MNINKNHWIDSHQTDIFYADRKNDKTTRGKYC